MQWHTPIGYKVLNGKIVVYEEHRRLVEQIFRDYDSGISALRIAKDLKEMGVKNAHDRVGWSHASIGRILENYNYLGTEDYEQIIDKELFDRVQKRREQVRIEGSRGKHRPNKRERLIFSGVLICAECGCPYSHIQPSHKKERYGVPKWKCKNYVYQNKVGSYTDEFDKRYRRIAEEITTLKEEQIEARRKKKLADSYEQRLKDMDSFLEKQTCQIPEFDNDLVRRLISNIKVVSAEKLLIQFQSGIVMEQEIRYE